MYFYVYHPISIIICPFYFIFIHQVLGRPSAELAEKLAEDEKNRIEVQRLKLGDEGLKNKKETLEAAIEQNEVSTLSRIYLFFHSEFKF